jgi:hypothetical protein|tara:strand:- start:1023 stop:1466 length:444 start_codon:yes stop_codon:yes gene_type:complete
MTLKTDNLPSRCVVLVPLDRIDAAKHIVDKFELSAVYEHHPALAMAEVCLLHQHATSVQAWNSKPNEVQLILVHANEMNGTTKMVHAVRKYLPNVCLSELRNGQLENIDNDGSVVDLLEDHPIVHTEPIDATELSMLLDDNPQKVDE